MPYDRHDISPFILQPLKALVFDLLATQEGCKAGLAWLQSEVVYPPDNDALTVSVDLMLSTYFD